jgi:LysR family pca operon transcriptional activator
MIGLSFEHLYVESLVLAVRSGHPLTTTPRFRLKTISDYPWILPHHGTIIRMETERFLLSHGIVPPTNVVETTSNDFGRSYLLCGDSIWFTPRGTVEPGIENGRIALLPLASGSMEGPVGITVRANTIATPSAAAMIDAIRRTALQRQTVRS